MELIQISNLFYKYHKTDVLENINLTIKDDDFLAIIGPNGGGKSTLLKLILGLLTPQDGKIEKKIKDFSLYPNIIGFKVASRGRQLLNFVERIDEIIDETIYKNSNY